MDWLELKIDTSPAGIDPVTEMLEEQGVRVESLAIIEDLSHCCIKIKDQ